MENEKILVILGIVFFVFIGFFVMLLLVMGGLDMGMAGERIAVIDLRGSISDSGGTFSDTVSSASINDLFDKVGEEPSVKGVILNIDSGGGGVVESKDIARGVKKLSEKKPVVSYIRSVGASGAYYIASASDLIIADEDSIVGSIGVISTYFVYKDLFQEKLGINATVIKSGRFKDMGSPYRSMTEEEEERLQEIVDKVHQEFIDEIKANRGLSTASLRQVAEGGIYLGSEALQLGLVDELGGFENAFERVKQLANAPRAELYYMSDEDVLPGLLDLSYSAGRGVGDSLKESLDASQFNKDNLEY
ncbi:MAG: signal peptide peptidase SppA [Candidatus Altiarchaeota archaeon]|nr:signal peptide peptidase SppA [Candidatus Altiarchaeota archaeon]